MSETLEKSADAIAAKTPRPRNLLIGGIIGLAVFGLFAFIVSLDVTHPFTQGMDDAWRRLVGSDHGPETGIVPMFFQYLGEGPGALVLGIIIPVVLIIVRRWRSALFFLAGFVGSGLVSQLVKNLVDRPRPADDLANGLFGPLFRVDHGSLPSGHAVTAGFVIVGVAALIPYAKRWIWWIAAVLIGVGMIWQRTLINAHWLSDTFAGLLAGAATTLILWWAFAPLLNKDRGRPARRRASASPSVQGAP